MKYGLITFKNTENIGDDIQSYSAIRFLPKIDYYIEREDLDLFVPKKKEQIVTMMNGWFVHSKLNFQLSPYIYPVFISTHISEYESGGIKSEFLSKYTINELKKYEPIGCRDSSTSKLLTKKGIENYISGCLTLSIEADKNIERTNKICLVDIEPTAEEYIKANLGDERIIKRTHRLNKYVHSKLSWDERFKKVKKLLDDYQSSKLVITSRLHCALPCLAIGTPVLLLYDAKKAYTKDRLSDYSKIVTSMSTKDFLESGIEKINKGIQNPNDYLKIRNSIQKEVQEKLNSINLKKYEKNLPKLDFYKKYYILPKQNINELYKVAIKRLEKNRRRNIENKYALEYWKKEFNRLLTISNPQEIAQQKEELSRLITKYENLCIENNYLKKRLEKRER